MRLNMPCYKGKGKGRSCNFFTVRRVDMWEGVGVSLRNIHFLHNR